VDGEAVVERRRQWTPEQKAALLAEVEAEGGPVSMVARRHRVSTSLLYNWRSAWKAAAMAARSTVVRPAEFVQLGVVADATGESPRVPMTAGAVCPRGDGLALAERVGVIEIDLPDGVRVRVDSSVNEKALRRVLSALRGSGYRPAAGNEGFSRLPADRSARRLRRPCGEGTADHRRRSVQRPYVHLPQQTRPLSERVVLGWQRPVPVRQAA
jgi:transposase